MRSGRFALIASTAAAVLAITAPIAGGAVVVGQITTDPSPECNGEFDVIQVASAGPGYVVPPPGGTITSWRTTTLPEENFQQMGLKVFRSTAPGAYTVVGYEGQKRLEKGELNTFTSSIPVEAGDVIGLHTGALAVTACLFKSGPGDIFGVVPGVDTLVGSAFAPNLVSGGSRLNIEATVELGPAIASVGPSKGSIKGGTAVTIAGTDLAGATAVTFAGAPAASFTVDSPGQITAVVPPVARPGSVDVAVTTPFGQPASLPRAFTYEACVVPKLKGKKLKAAKKAIRRAGCRVGKVRGPKGKAARVGKQGRKAKKVFAPGTRVSVKTRAPGAKR